MEPNLCVAVCTAEGLQEGSGGAARSYRDITLLGGGGTASWSTLPSFSSQYLAFFEFNNRLEAILSKAYIYR